MQTCKNEVKPPQKKEINAGKSRNDSFVLAPAKDNKHAKERKQKTRKNNKTAQPKTKQQKKQQKQQHYLRSKKR